MTDISQKIHEEISSLRQLMESQPDLVQDVLPFISSTLSKIEKFSDDVSIEENFQLSHDLLQMACNYLPRTINSYCDLSIEYRNKKPIKAEKTARDLLIEDLSNIKKEVERIEENILSEITKNIKINNSFLNQKFSSGMQLAQEASQLGQDGFINVFDIDNFKSSDQFDKLFKRHKKQNQFQQTLSQAIPTAQNFLFHSKNIMTKIKYSWYDFSEKNKYLVNTIFAIFAVATFFVTVIGFAGYLGDKTFRESRLVNAFKQSSEKIYASMQANALNDDQIKSLAKTQNEDLIDGLIYRKNLTSIDAKNQLLIINLKSMSNQDCINFVDVVHVKQPYSSISVNGVNYKIDSETFVAQEIAQSRSVCNLSKNNSVSVSYDAKDIYENTSADRKSLEKYQVKIDTMQRKLKAIENQINSPVKDANSELYTIRNAYEEEIKEAQTVLNMQKSFMAQER